MSLEEIREMIRSELQEAIRQDRELTVKETLERFGLDIMGVCGGCEGRRGDLRRRYYTSGKELIRFRNEINSQIDKAWADGFMKGQCM